MNKIGKGGVPMRNIWLSVLRSSHKGLEYGSCNAASNAVAEFSSLAAKRSRIIDFSRKVACRAGGNSILHRDKSNSQHALIFPSSHQLAMSTAQNLRNSFFVRCLTSESSESKRRKESETRKEISTVEDPFDAPTYNIPEKPVTFTEGASYSIIILAGLGIAGAAAYGVFKELIFEPKEYKIFNKALDRVQNDGQVRVRIGSPITGYGSESRNRAARQRIPNKTWTDEDGVEHVMVNFHIRGPHGAGKVYAEMFKDKVDKQWKFMYLIVEVTSPSPAQLMLESYVPA
ncbi:probable mitochondrial import inner membrane translocase subunit TIM21 isoform X2 [Andrographis paniculata]|uniref:probable mitochondrial import inner membrane translocase subunit TIM21 isoform X2 n=1 Tax=Andrographis paniculata TaxID=175694 RepID=UPI0021E9A6BD|nr:probable mitochondrial import inner membrane translocase subunit TIM21 isoform X2 [Andrographis paniculata]